jgi:hypothetical protein
MPHFEEGSEAADTYVSPSSKLYGVYDLRPTTHDLTIAAQPLHLSGRRRVIPGSDWVAIPNVIRAGTAPFKPQEDSTMKWTKPEAEVVAVTMEVTAYVATL